MSPFEWDKHTTKQEIYKNLFNNQLLADVKFIFPHSDGANPKTIYSHSFLLSIHSQTFHKIFYEASNEASTSTNKINDFYELVITDTSYTIFYEFINYFYDLNINRILIKKFNGTKNGNLYSVLKLAHDYDVAVLRKCILHHFDRHMMHRINFSNIVNTLQISNMVQDAKYASTYKNSVTFIQRNFNKFLKLKLPSKLDRAGLAIFLSLNEVGYGTREIDIYCAVIAWIEKQTVFNHTTGNYREVLGDRLIKLIRFPSMSYNQFKKVMAIDAPQVLDDDETRKLYSYITNTTFASENELVDLCGYNHIPRKQIKQWRDYRWCHIFAPFKGVLQKT